jgi:hypothetical protein
MISLMSAAMGWVLISPTPSAKPFGDAPEYISRSSHPNYVKWANVTNSIGTDGTTNPGFYLAEWVTFWGAPQLATMPTTAVSGIAPADLDMKRDQRGAISITWALHPDFCDKLLGKFPEDVYVKNIFLNCGVMRRAVADAIGTWSSNTRNLKFMDMTPECAKDGAISEDSAGNPVCAHAEVFIIAEIPGVTIDDNVAAYVSNSYASLDATPILASGVQLARGDGLRASRMQVSNDICWYLDTTFCYTFHRWDEGNVDVIMINRIIFAVGYVVACLIFLYVTRPSLRC